MREITKRVLLIVVVGTILATDLQAQFLQLSLVLDSEMRVSVNNDLSFGSMFTTDSVDVPLGDFRMGVIQIDGMTGQLIKTRIDYSRYMVHETFPDCESVECRIEISLTFLLSRTPTVDNQNLASLRPIDQLNGLEVILTDPDGLTAEFKPMSSAYVLVFGRATSLDVIPGAYSGFLTLWLDY